MESPADRLQRIESSIGGQDQAAFVTAVQELVRWSRTDSTIHSQALPLFQSAAQARQFPYGACSAAEGIALLAGPAAAKPYRESLLSDSDPAVARAAVVYAKDPAEAPRLIELLNQHADSDLRCSVLRIIARLKASEAFDTLIQSLNDPTLRAHAVESLGELGDPRAIPALVALGSDTTHAWPIDNHGPMLRVCDLARTAIGALAPPLPPMPGVPPLPPQSNSGTHHAAPPPLRIGPRTASPVVRFFKSGRAWSYLPLLVLIFEIPWVLLSALFLLFLVGDAGPVTPSATRATEVFASVPLVIGALLGIFTLIFLRSGKLLDLIVLGAGTAACLFFIYRTFS